MAMPTLNLYRNRYVGIAVGPFIRVSALEMRERGVEVVLQSLAENPERSTDAKPELETFSKDEERVFFRDHRGVYVEVVADCAMRLGPLRKRGSGFVVPREEVLELSLPVTNEVFRGALGRALGGVSL